jgi:hypothetical protein
MHCSSSSSSDAAYPPEKKGKQLWNAGISIQPKHKLKILSSWILLPPGDKDRTSGVQVPAKYQHLPAVLIKRIVVAEGQPGTFPINTEEEGGGGEKEPERNSEKKKRTGRERP